MQRNNWQQLVGSKLTGEPNWRLFSRCSRRADLTLTNPIHFMEPAQQLAVGAMRNMTVSWRRRPARVSGAGWGVSSMMIGMLVAGIGLILAGLLAIGYGIPIKEFSVGNTLILAGVVGACTGVLMFGLWAAVRELQKIGRRLGAGADGGARPQRSSARHPLPSARVMAAFCSAAIRRSEAQPPQPRLSRHRNLRQRRHGMKRWPTRSRARRTAVRAHACGGAG